jgi:hypothetical protein
MIKLSWITAPAFAACLLLAGCFTSDQPLFDPATSSPIMGTKDVKIAVHEGNGPDDGVLIWNGHGYTDKSDTDASTIAFYRLPGTLPWDGWYVGQTNLSGQDARSGYLYELYKKAGNQLNVYNVSCKDLTDVEVTAAHLARTESGQECKATRQADLAKAFRLLAKRKSPDSYWTYGPALPGETTPPKP